MIKIFRNSDTKALSEDVAAFYNRQGRIGNHLGNAKLHLMENGEIAVTISYSGKIDDGRQIDDIEDRKSIFITKVDGTDAGEIDAFLEMHKDDYVSQPYITAVGNSLLVFIAATKIVPIQDTWNDDDDDDEDNDNGANDDPSSVVSQPVSAPVPAPVTTEADTTAPDAAADDYPWFN